MKIWQIFLLLFGLMWVFVIAGYATGSTDILAAHLIPETLCFIVMGAIVRKMMGPNGMFFIIGTIIVLYLTDAYIVHTIRTWIDILVTVILSTSYMVGYIVGGRI